LVFTALYLLVLTLLLLVGSAIYSIPGADRVLADARNVLGDLALGFIGLALLVLAFIVVGKACAKIRKLIRR